MNSQFSTTFFVPVLINSVLLFNGMNSPDLQCYYQPALKKKHMHLAEKNATSITHCLISFFFKVSGSENKFEGDWSELNT